MWFPRRSRFWKASAVSFMLVVGLFLLAAYLVAADKNQRVPIEVFDAIAEGRAEGMTEDNVKALTMIPGTMHEPPTREYQEQFLFHLHRPWLDHSEGELYPSLWYSLGTDISSSRPGMLVGRAATRSIRYQVEGKREIEIGFDETGKIVGVVFFSTCRSESWFDRTLVKLGIKQPRIDAGW